MAREHGDVSHFGVGPRHVYLLIHPEHVRDVLVTHARRFEKGPAMRLAARLLGNGLLTSEGDFHLRQRRLIQPAFVKSALGHHGETMVRHAERLALDWRDGDVRDVAADMSRLTLGIAAETLFGADVDSEAREIREALGDILGMFDLGLLPLVSILEKIRLPILRRFERPKARLDATVLRLIANRRAAGGDRHDFLSLLLAARDQEGDGKGMTNEQVRDEAITIFLAGHETTANALAWTWHLLGDHPEAEARLHAELDATLGSRLPDVEDLPRLAFTESVVSESMRLRPPAWAMGRRAIELHQAGPWPIPAGSVVLVSQWVTQRDPRWWRDPLRFDPDRFLPEPSAARPRFAYFPFGGGPRQCIGEGFAWMEAVLCLATLARRWRLRGVPGHPVALHPSITLRPRHGLRMVLSRRPHGA